VPRAWVRVARLDAQAADTVARLILGDAEQESARPVDSRLAKTARPQTGRGGEGRTPWREGGASGGFEPPRVAPPGPKLPTRRVGRCSPGPYRPLNWGMLKGRPILYPLIPGHHGASRAQSREHRGFRSRPGRGRLSLRSSATRDRIGRPGTARPIQPSTNRPLACKARSGEIATCKGWEPRRSRPPWRCLWVPARDRSGPL
jgi:hypothetical protein